MQARARSPRTDTLSTLILAISLMFRHFLSPEIGGFSPICFAQAAKETRIPSCLKAGILNRRLENSKRNSFLSSIRTD
jgi:hypothetical protein